MESSTGFTTSTAVKDTASSSRRLRYSFISVSVVQVALLAIVNQHIVTLNVDIHKAAAAICVRFAPHLFVGTGAARQNCSFLHPDEHNAGRKALFIGNAYRRGKSFLSPPGDPRKKQGKGLSNL